MKSQRGVTLVQVVFFVCLAVFVGVLGFSLVPPFMEHQTLKHSLKDMAKVPDMKKYDTPRLRKVAMKHIRMNNIQNAKETDLMIEKKNGHTYLTVNYEVRVHIVGNVDAILKFDESILVE